MNTGGTNAATRIIIAPWAICSSRERISRQSCVRPTQASQLGSILSSFDGTSWGQSRYWIFCLYVEDKTWYLNHLMETYEPGKGPRIFSIIARCSLTWECIFSQTLKSISLLVPVVMSLEEGEPKVELKHDAPWDSNFDFQIKIFKSST